MLRDVTKTIHGSSQVGLSSSIPNGANGAATLWVLSTLPTDRLLDLLNTPLSVPSEGSAVSV